MNRFNMHFRYFLWRGWLLASWAASPARRTRASEKTGCKLKRTYKKISKIKSIMKLNNPLPTIKFTSITAHLFLYIFMLISFMPCVAQRLPTTSAPVRTLMDADWRFHLEEGLPLANVVKITNWRWKSDNHKGAETENAARNVDVTGADWNDSKSGDDNMGWPAVYKWFRTTLPNVPGPHRVIHFETVDDDCTIYLNGKEIAKHKGWNDPFDVAVDAAWDDKNTNTLALIIHNSPSHHGGVTAAVTLGSQLPVKPAKPAYIPDFNDQSWSKVHLPHDYVMQGTFTQQAEAAHGFLPMRSAWYRKTFTLPASASGKSIWIDFDGVYRNSIVYLNGKKLGQHTSGYTSFRYDISKAANFGGKNVLAVHVDPRRFEGWFYEGGGIYRHVWLNIANRVHVAPWGTFVTAEMPEPVAGGSIADAKIHIKTKLLNEGSVNASCEVISRLIDKNGKEISQVSDKTIIPAGGKIELAQEGKVEHPQLWSLETPTLYKLQTWVKINGVIVDTYNTPFGIRTIRYDANQGFFLNGKHVKLQGMCIHQDFAGVGIGIPDSLDYWRVKQFMKMGGNAWRMSHNPPSPALLNACDELGVLVMAENRHLGNTYTDHTESGVTYTDPQDLTDMLLRDRNHPSIIMWSMCNEEWLQNTPEGAKILSGMMNTVRLYDTTRPVTSAMNGGWFDPGFTTIEDIVGVNYSPNIYDRFHTEHPSLPMYGSETSSSKMTRGEYANDASKQFISSYSLTNDYWKSVGERAFMAGSFGWTGMDYKGEAKWPGLINQSGAMDVCGFPKDGYYYYQAWWKTTPIIHIMPHWNWAGKEGQEIRVVVLSNCEEVELFLNGMSLGKKDMPRYGHLEWPVKYTPGTITAKGYNKGSLAISEAIESTGTPVSLRLKTDRTSLLADGEDIIPVEVDILDANGRIVPTANNRVTFRVEGAGAIAGSGNGSPIDQEPNKSPARDALNGKCLVLLGAGEKAGKIILTVSSPGLKSAVIVINAKADTKQTR